MAVRMRHRKTWIFRYWDQNDMFICTFVTLSCYFYDIFFVVLFYFVVVWRIDSRIENKYKINNLIHMIVPGFRNDYYLWTKLMIFWVFFFIYSVLKLTFENKLNEYGSCRMNKRKFNQAFTFQRKIIIIFSSDAMFYIRYW